MIQGNFSYSPLKLHKTIFHKYYQLEDMAFALQTGFGMEMSFATSTTDWGLFKYKTIAETKSLYVADLENLTINDFGRIIL
jgi:hypothetical protein